MNIKRLFSFDWFGSEERKEIKEKIKQLELENARLTGQKVLLEEFQKKINEIKTPIKPYKNLYFTGTNVTVITETGMLQSECSLEQYELIKEAKTEEEIKNILYKKEQKEEEYEFQKDDVAILKVNDDFEVINKEVFLKPVKLKLPDIVTATFIELLEKKLAISSAFYPQDLQTTIHASNELKELDEQYEGLKIFWYKLSTNSVEKCRESVLRFCKDNDVKISRLGNLITYRCVEVYNKETKFNKDLKAVLKTVSNPNNYYLLQSNLDNSLKTVHKYTNKNRYPKDYNVLGKLSEISLEKQETVYTSQHSYGKYTFKIGDVYKLNEDEKPDDSLQNCSSHGLHSASCHWNYSSFGKVPVVALINPAKTIFVPSSDSGKFRCSEMKIACLNPNEIGVHIDYELIKQADEEYNDYTIEQLQEIVKTKSFENVSVGENLPLLNLQDIKDIAEILKQKIVKI